MKEPERCVPVLLYIYSMKLIGTLLAILFFWGAQAQELYVFTEPASNMPARAVAFKYGGKFVRPVRDGNLESRHTADFQFGWHKNFMTHFSTGFSDMYTSNMRWESARLYTQYRFFTSDGVHRHFRMAAFLEGAASRNPLRFDEINLNGDQSGAQGGLIFTQLWHKLAVSSTIGYAKVLREIPKVNPQPYPGQAFNYSLSAGYLLFPRKYTSYKQTNFNIYTELLGQQTLDKKRFYVDLAPAVQFIFNSNTKLNLGYRFQLNGDMNRMAEKSWMIGIDRTFLNALKKRKAPVL